MTWLGYLGTAILVLIVRVSGGRVTSWLRSPSENEAVGGLSASKHLVGGAVDVGREFAGAGLRVTKLLSENANPWDDAGTAEHWHFEGGLKAVGAVVLVLVILKGLL